MPWPAKAALRAAFAVVLAAPLLLATYGLTGAGGPSLLTWMTTWGTIIVFATAAALGLARARLVEHERWAWTWLAISGLCWAASNLYYAVAIAPGPAPMPSPLDIGYVCAPVAACIGLVHAARARVPTIRTDLVLDGLLAGLGTAAAATAVIFRFVSVDAGDLPAVITTLIYPIEDVVLLGAFAAAGSMLGWRLGRSWVLVGVALLSIASADTLVFGHVLAGVPAYGAWTNLGWTAGVALVALGAWQRPVGAGEAVAARPRRELAIPVVFAPLALAVLTLDQPLGLEPIATVPASLGLMVACARLYRSFAEVRALAESRRLALTDDLTGLANRRRLAADLASACTSGQPRLLALFDLDGFKHYNDTHGHPEGDVLLRALAERLVTAVGDDGDVYRLGGDEFCVLAAAGEGGEAAVARATAALAAGGAGWSVQASCGVVALPAEADDPAAAMRIADRRMYAQKDRRPGAARRQVGDVLLRALGEQQPGLHSHAEDVTGMAREVAVQLGMCAEDIDDVVRAAELHDVGKLAVPREILDKPGPLDNAEWAVMRRHTVIGERMLLAAPALAAVAPLVRSSHERWDGGGYPDGLCGPAIPLGARIVAVCDAFDAMTTDRVYRRGMAPKDALTELRRCAGTQFDPAVVDAFVAAWRAEHAVAARAA